MKARHNVGQKTRRTYLTRREVEERNSSAALNWQVVALRTGAFGFEAHTIPEIATEMHMRPEEVRKRFRLGMESQGRFGSDGVKERLQNWPENTYQFSEDGEVPKPTRRKYQGSVFGQFVSGFYVQDNLGVTHLRPNPGGDSWASDSCQPPPDQTEAYTDGWLAYHEDVEEENNPYRSGGLRDAWAYGYEDAQEEAIEDDSSVA